MAFRNGKAACTLCSTGSGGTPTPVARRVIQSTVVASVNSDSDVSGPLNDGNLDTDLGDLSGLDFGLVTSVLDIFLNGARQHQGITALTAEDVYPGTALADGQLRFKKKLKVGDKVTVIDWG